MNKPRIRIDANAETIKKVEEIIEDTLAIDYIHALKIEEMSVQELDLLGEYAKQNDLFISIKAEHSNFHQGVLVNLIRRDLVDKFIKYL